MVTVPTMLHERVAVLPVATIVAAVVIRIARTEVLAICVRIELCAVAWVGDHLLLVELMSFRLTFSNVIIRNRWWSALRSL